MRDYALNRAQSAEATGAFSLFGRLLSNWRARRALSRLDTLDDFLLRDIGVTREEVLWAMEEGLASGAVAGVSTSAVSGVDGKFWEFLKTIYPTNHIWGSQMVNVSLDAWKKLTPEQQKTIEDVAKKLEPEFWAVSLKADTDSLARLKEGGMEVVQIPAPMMKDLREKTASLLNDFMKRVPASEAPIKAYLAEMKR